MTHIHHGVVDQWGFDDKQNWIPKIYKCKECGETSEGPFPEVQEPEVDHSKCSYDPCFGCKAKSLQLGTGDSGRPMSAKKWDAELNAYSSARKQGIQPAGTTMRAVEDALKKSDKAGKAFDANTGGYKG
jgi:hypothetical protein